MNLQVESPAGPINYESDASRLRVASRLGTKIIEWNQVVGAGPFGFHIPVHIALPENAPGMLGLAAKAEHMLEANQAYWIAYKPGRSTKLTTISVPRTGEAGAQLITQLRQSAGANWRPDPALRMEELRKEFGVHRRWWAVPVLILVVLALIVAGLVALLATSVVVALLHDIRVALVVLFVAALWFVIKQFRTRTEQS